MSSDVNVVDAIDVIASEIGADSRRIRKALNKAPKPKAEAREWTGEDANPFDYAGAEPYEAIYG